jgi:branched-chain amino acid transport system ATP-binding protein
MATGPTPFSRSMLEVEDLVSGYGEIDVLRGVSASFAPERVTTIIGANGAGKSTFLKTIFGILPARAGKVRFAGQEITGWPSRKVLGVGIAYVPQGRCNFPAMSVQDNLLVSLDHHRRRAKLNLASRLEAIYQQFPLLADKRSVMAGNLSGGQQQIMEMSIALLQEPELLLIDEPSLGLSPTMLEQVFGCVTEIAATHQVTVVMVEQNAKQALAISDAGIVLELGKVRMQASASELLAHRGIRDLYLGG